MFSDARMGRAMNTEDVDLLVEEISTSVMRHPHALISLSRLKTTDEYTYMHSVAVCALMVALARQMDLDEDQVREAGVAGLMHDVGKMMIDPAILNKPDRLTYEEYEVMKHHPQAGLEILQGCERVTRLVMDVCLHHHEKVDGSGYPHGLKDEEISLLAKMGAICDVYDAVTSDRPYKKGWDGRTFGSRDGVLERPLRRDGVPALRQDRRHLPRWRVGPPEKRAPGRGGRTG